MIPSVGVNTSQVFKKLCGLVSSENANVNSRINAVVFNMVLSFMGLGCGVYYGK